MLNSNRLDFLANISIDSSESDIEHKIIVPLLRLLGYDHEDWQTQTGTNGTKVDFLISPKEIADSCPPYLVIEVKAPRKKLAQATWQISRYMRQTGAILGLLTNGCIFYLLCNHQGKIAKIAEYQSADLIVENHLFYRLLSKKVCLKLGSAIVESQQEIRLKFLSIVSKAFSSEDTFGFSKGMHLTQNTLEQTETSSQRNSKGGCNGMIITVFNNKGGVGKTTMTINLAAALSKLGKKVLLIDVDPQANLTTGLGIDPLNDVEKHGKKDISHLLTDPRTTLEEVIIKKRWDDVYLDIVPSHIRLIDMEQVIVTTPDVDRVLAKKTKKYISEYDYIFIDPPPSFSRLNIIALMASSGVLIPTQLSSYPIRALEYVIDRAIAIDQSRDEPLPILGVAISMYNKTASKVAREMTEEIVKVLQKNPESRNVEIFPKTSWIPNLSVISTTPNKGYPICFAEFDEDLEHREKEAAQDAFNCYTNLANHLINTSVHSGGI